MWLVSDANIFIDMEIGGVLEPMFSLPEAIAVPDVLYEEELKEQHPHLLQMGLKSLEVRAEFVNEAWRMGGLYKKPSQNDLLALALAKQEKCPLLTGDARLREAALCENVDVRGTLWLMERLFTEAVLDVEEIEIAYEKMRKEGRRLPWQDVEVQLQRFHDKKGNT